MSFIRTDTAASDRLVSCNGARTTHWQTPRSGNSVMEIQTYPDSSKITKAQRDQLGMLNSALPVVYTAMLIVKKHHRFTGTGTKKSTLLSLKGALYANSLHVPKPGICTAAMSHEMSKSRPAPQDSSSDRESTGNADFSTWRTSI
jgi:hypothetical protein